MTEHAYQELASALEAPPRVADRTAGYSMEADERLRAVRRLLEWNGCECECEHHWEDHDDDCDRCLACRIAEAVGR